MFQFGWMFRFVSMFQFVSRFQSLEVLDTLKIVFLERLIGNTFWERATPHIEILKSTHQNDLDEIRLPMTTWS